MTAGSKRKQRRKRTLVVRLDALATKRIVIEVPADGIERSVAVRLGNPPATQCDAVTIERLAAEIDVFEIKPNTAKEIRIRIVTAVPGDAAYEVARTYHRLGHLLEDEEWIDSQRKGQSAKHFPKWR